MIIDILATVVGILMSLGYYPQAYKILKSKSSKDISITSYSIFSIGTLIWFIYGIVINSLPIIFSFALGVIGSWLVLILLIIYHKKK
ncbi:MAG: SemiSWEET family sugar transporter [Candidatus Woesearchaeota archaeon]